MSALSANATDTGLTKIGTGTLTLAGADTCCAGATNVSVGTLQLEGSSATGPFTTSGISVGNSGRLGFTAGAASVLNLAATPLSLGGTLAFDIGATGVNDSVTVNDFSLTGNSFVALNAIGAFTSGASYTVLTSVNPITTGGFSLSGQTVGRLSVTPTVSTNTVTITPTLDEGIWNQTGGGNWSDGNPSATAGNWTNYKPTVTGDAALFGSAITSPSTINVDTAHSVGYMRFDNSNAYTIGSNGSANLTLDNGCGPGHGRRHFRLSHHRGGRHADEQPARGTSYRHHAHAQRQCQRHRQDLAVGRTRARWCFPEHLTATPAPPPSPPGQ